jgi:hypothetical protein
MGGAPDLFRGQPDAIASERRLAEPCGCRVGEGFAPGHFLVRDRPKRTRTSTSSLSGASVTRPRTLLSLRKTGAGVHACAPLCESVDRQLDRHRPASLRTWLTLTERRLRGSR